MYEILRIVDKVRVPPEKFKEKLEESILDITREEYEGLIDEDLGIIVLVNNAKKLGAGKIIPGDGAAYYEAELEMIVYKPKIGEVIEGKVSEITEFGAFVELGPMEGLVHVSQIMDEFMNYDAKNNYFIGKKTKRKLSLEDILLARVVVVSLKGSITDSKIGLTMRQPFLGEYDWIEKEIKEGKKEKKEVKEGKETKKAEKKKTEEKKGEKK